MEAMKEFFAFVNNNGYSLEVYPIDVLNPGFGWIARLVGHQGIVAKAEDKSAYDAMVSLGRQFFTSFH